jgi:Rrf2 family protein
VPCALRISEAASLAMHAMGLLATDPDRALSAKAIAASFDVSEAHLSKVMQRMTKAGLVTSARGPGGGFALARQPDEVSLLEVFQAIEGPLDPADCVFNVPQCDGSSCVLGSVLVEVNDILWKHLSGTTIADVGHGFETSLAQILPGRAGISNQ